MNSSRRSHEHRLRSQTEATTLNLRSGDTHPETGMVYLQRRFYTPAAYHKCRIALALNAIHQRARAAGLPFDLTTEWYQAVWPPNGRCEVLPAIQLEWGSANRNTSPSVDRIRPNRGYVQTNCRVISQRANTLKNNATAQEMALVLADLRKHDSAH